MKRYSILFAGCTLLAMGAPAAYADCAAEIAKLSGTEGQAGVSKDGTLAPLETAGDAGATAQTGAGTTTMAGSDAAAAEGEGVAKDGSTVPLEAEGGAAAGVAMSEQDAQAQQEGGATVAEQAAGDATGSSDRTAVIEKAQAALDAGDEAACMEAVEEAQKL